MYQSAITAALICVLAGGAWTAAGAVSWENTAAGEILTYAPGARELGMGGAAVATASGHHAIHHNPALVALTQDAPSFGMTYREPAFRDGFRPPDYAAHFDVVVDSGTAFGLRGRTGVSLAMLETPRGSVGGSMIAVGAGYGRRVSEELAWGVRLVWVRDAGSQQASYTVASDLGGIWKPREDMTVGAALRNFGPAMDYGGAATQELPLALTVGMGWLAYARAGHGLTVACDLTKPLVREPGNRWYMSPALGWLDDGAGEEIGEIDIAAGVEYSWHGVLRLRSGLLHDADGERTRLTAGCGFRIPLGGRSGGASETMAVDFSSLVLLRDEPSPTVHESRKFAVTLSYAR